MKTITARFDGGVYKMEVLKKHSTGYTVVTPYGDTANISKSQVVKKSKTMAYRKRKTKKKSSRKIVPLGVFKKLPKWSKKAVSRAAKKRGTKRRY